jgi:hypothetical protein
MATPGASLAVMWNILASGFVKTLVRPDVCPLSQYSGIAAEPALPEVIT